jgi:hypothetical protein
VLIPAIGQRIQDFDVDDGHELSRLWAETLSKRLIGSLEHSGPPAFFVLLAATFGRRRSPHRRILGHVRHPPGA